jgi:hypothetical protein
MTTLRLCLGLVGKLIQVFRVKGANPVAFSNSQTLGNGKTAASFRIFDGRVIHLMNSHLPQKLGNARMLRLSDFDSMPVLFSP